MTRRRCRKHQGRHQSVKEGKRRKQEAQGASLDAMQCPQKVLQTGLFHAKRYRDSDFPNVALKSLRQEAATNWYLEAANKYCPCEYRSRIHLGRKAGLLFCEKYQISDYAKVKVKSYSGGEKFETTGSAREWLNYSA